MGFAENLRALLKAHNMQQNEFARQCNVTKSAVTNWVTGLREPDFAMLVKIADIFSVSVDLLLGRDDLEEHIEQTKVLRAYRALSPKQREFAMAELALIQKYAEREPAPEEKMGGVRRTTRVRARTPDSRQGGGAPRPAVGRFDFPLEWKLCRERFHAPLGGRADVQYKKAKPPRAVCGTARGGGF